MREKMLQQQTLRSSITLKGKGVHSGLAVQITLSPAPVDSGIVFQRIDLTPAVKIRATADSVGDTACSTSLIEGGIKIATIEHLMAACAGMGVDNLLVSVTAGEIPIMDGSAAFFVAAIQRVGLVKQAAVKSMIRVKKAVKVEQAEKWGELLPAATTVFQITMQYEHPVLARMPQQLRFELGKDNFMVLSQARTFGLFSDYERLRAMNLALGSDLENTIAIGSDRVINSEGLRNESECIQHKVLDAMGDFYMEGHLIQGEFIGFKSGHGLNNLLLRKLLSDSTAWEYVTDTIKN